MGGAARDDDSTAIATPSGITAITAIITTLASW